MCNINWDNNCYDPETNTCNEGCQGVCDIMLKSACKPRGVTPRRVK